METLNTTLSAVHTCFKNNLKNKSFGFESYLAFLIAATINGLVLANTILHHPKVGYDVKDHITYMQVLPYHLPTPADTREFFSPPLPYFIPSLVDQVCAYFQKDIFSCRWMDGKTAQVLNFFLSIGITIILWKIASLIHPGSGYFKVSMFALLATETVYYKTFSQARGEPYVAFFVSLLIFLILNFLQKTAQLRTQDGVIFGLVSGLLILSRQWGFLIFPALAILVIIALMKDFRSGLHLIRVFVTASLVAFLVGGWYYLHLYTSYGKITAFNMEEKEFSWTNQPASFYTTSGLKNFLLFRKPTRPAFNNQFIPIFYSETWGDYWCYFTCISSRSMLWRRNLEVINPYLGRVNLVSLFPSLILILGVVLGGISFLQTLFQKQLSVNRSYMGFLFAVLLFSFTGFLWFLVKYPIPDSGVTIKATYMIQIFIILPILGAAFLEKVRHFNRSIFYIGLIGILFVFVHNLPALVTRYIAS